MDPVEFPYAPATPAKPDRPDPDMICENEPRNQFNLGSTSQLFDINGGIYNNFCMDNVETWHSISCRDLLALADATIITNGSSIADYTLQYGGLNPSTHLSIGLSSQFTPVTPDHARRVECGQAASDIIISNEEGADNDKEKSNLDEQLQPIIEQSQGDNSTLVEANQDFEKGLTEGTNINETPQPKQRRRKHRPKVVREGQPKRVRKSTTPKEPDDTSTTPNPNGTSTGKRKYVRRKGVEKPTPTTPIMEETNGTVDPSPDQQTKSSCKRKINFDEPENGTKVMVEKTRVELTVDEAKTCESPSPITPSKTEVPHERSICRKAKCCINFLQETHDKGPSSIPSPHESSASASASTSINASSASTSVGISASTEQSSKTEGIRVCCESLESYLSLFTDYKSGTPLPAIFKKKRIRKGQSSATSTKENGCGLSAERNAGKAPEMSKVNGMQALGHLENSKKKRSKGLTQMSDSASYAGMMGGQWQTPAGASGYEASRQRHMYMEALAADFQVSIPTKKRMKKKSSTMPSLYHNHIGCHPNLRVKNIYDIDALVKEFEWLDISNRVAEEDRGALVPYLSEYHDKNALVLYQRDGTLVPFEGLFNPMKKRKPRPKVDLDDETSRVWRLLLEDINSQGIDGTDEDKAKWWEEERRVFRGRADSFIARMHLVQGDRRFSRWKGSVLDSVIGVFLTQNVSDHLSSSAFMSLAARYPHKLKSSSEPLQEEKPLLSVKEPYQVDHDETINGSMMLQDAESCKEKVVNINEFSKNSTCTVGLNDNNSECEVLEIEDIVSSQNSADTSPTSVQSSIAHTTERLGSCSTHSSGEQKDGPKATVLDGYTSFVELLHMQRPTMVHEMCSQGQAESMVNSPGSSTTSKPTLNRHGSGALEVEYFEMREETKIIQKKSEEKCASEESGLSVESASQARVQMVRTTSSQEIFHCEMIVENPKINTDDSNCEVQEVLDIENVLVETFEATESNNNVQKVVEFNLNDCGSNQVVNGMDEGSSKVKTVKTGKVKQIKVDWDSLRLQAEVKEKRERDPDTMDSLDYDAVMNADVNDIADAIKERGMNNVLAGRIKDLLDRLVRDHGSIDLEWLRDVPPDKAKEYLLSFRGLGLKSVECVRLLTLHHLAFPVDTNVGRIAVRLGWVPLQPLPESLQLHLLELYPVLESIQKYLWPRLCKLDQRTLYELHYQMITFGKVFCTKSKPNCNACPMRGECRHFASAFASARLGLPAPEEKVIVNAIENRTSQTAIGITNQQPLTLPPANDQLPQQLEIQICNPVIEEPASPEPIVEVPATPEPEQIQQQELDIEDFCEDPEEIPMIKLNIEQFTQNLQTYMEKHMELGECDMSKALVALTSEAAAIPTPKLKNVSQLRTEHQVYELPDSHPLLEGLDTREPDDPCSYLLAIWTPGETADSIQPPEGQCSSQESGTLCNEETCFFCNSTREANSQTVRGTLLIPCRTAMRGSFPLNGTYFQVNEVFADHESSLNPIDVPRSWLWNLPRRIVYFGTSIPTIFKGLTTEDIQYCFWRGFVCVRGFDQKTRAPRPLMARLHFPASKLKRSRGKTDDIKH